MPHTPFTIAFVWLLAATTRTRARVTADGERGDIPGWVMIAIMSAAVVVVLIPLVGGAVSTAFTDAINSVTGTGG